MTRALIGLVTSRRLLAPAARTSAAELAALERQAAEAIDAGVDLIFLREPDLEARVLVGLAARVKAAAAGRATRLIVNDRADVVCAAGADGVHLRGDGPPASRVRPLLPAGRSVGRSIHRAAEARMHQDTDYLLFGSVWASASKAGEPRAAGLAALGEAVAASAVPVLAIGGLTVERAAACVNAGAAGVAAIGLFLPPDRRAGALGAADAVRALREALPAAAVGVRG